MFPFCNLLLLVTINFGATFNRKTLVSGEKEFTQVSSGEVSQTDGWSQFTVNFTSETDLTSNAAALDIYLGGTPTDAAFFLDQVSLLAVIAANSNKGRKNVLFIGADDLRPNLGTYSSVTSATLGGPTMHTPNIALLVKTVNGV